MGIILIFTKRLFSTALMIVLIVATWVYAFPKKEKKKADSISWYGLCSKVNSLDLDELSMLKVLTGTKGLGKVRETVGLIYLTLRWFD